MAEPTEPTDAAPEPPRAVLPHLDVLKERSDFLRTARGRRVARNAFVLQARQRDRSEDLGDEAAMRIGFTCSKKVGNAVARNRAKRRLREIARKVLPQYGLPGWDYVLIGRAKQTATRDFLEMTDDLRRALSIIHGRAT